MLHQKLTNNKKQVVKKNTDEFKYECDTQTCYVEEMKNETWGWLCWNWRWWW